MHILSLAAGVLPEFSPEQTARAAATAGFDATGVWVDTATWQASTSQNLKAIFTDSGCHPLDVEVIWLQPGPLTGAQRKVIDIGLDIGAANALIVSSDPDDAGTAAKIAELCGYAKGGIRIALEFGMFTAVKTLGQAAAIIAQVGDPAAAILIDPIHLSRSGGGPADITAIDPRCLPYAQFCDAAPLDFDINDRDAVIVDAVDGRLLPGAGILPLSAVLDVLPANIPLSIELRSKALRDGYADPVERARVVADATRAFFARVEVRAEGGRAPARAPAGSFSS